MFLCMITPLYCLCFIVIYKTCTNKTLHVSVNGELCLTKQCTTVNNVYA